MPGDPRELVFALCHEVRNLLTAVRLQAELLEGETQGAELALARERLLLLSARSGALLAQVPPLLSQPALGERVEPADAIAALRVGLFAPASERVDLELKSAALAPCVRIGGDLLHVLLITALFGALELAPGLARVRVSAEARDTGVVFRIEGPVRVASGGDGGGELSGRQLELACADAILAPLGGRARVRVSDALRRCELELPAAE